MSAACVGLLSGLITVSTKINGLRTDYKNANKRIGALQDELDSCQRSLSLFYGSGDADRYPQALQADLEKVIRECSNVVAQIDTLLDRVSSESLMSRVRWSISIQDEVMRLHQNLEGHKSALTIAIAFASLSMTRGIKSDTSSIRSKTALLPEIQDQLAAVLQAIHTLSAEDPSRAPELGIAMQRFLQEAYAESVDGSLYRSSTIKSYSIQSPTTSNPFDDSRAVVSSRYGEQTRLERDETYYSGSASSMSGSSSMGSLSNSSYYTQPTATNISIPRTRNDRLDELPIVHVRTKSTGDTKDSVGRRTYYLSPSGGILVRQTQDFEQRRNSLFRRKQFFPEALPSFEVDHQTLENIDSLLKVRTGELRDDFEYLAYTRTAREQTARFSKSTLGNDDYVSYAKLDDAVSLYHQGQVQSATSQAKELAENGHISSQIMYALSLRYGVGCQTDPEEALVHFYAAAGTVIEAQLQRLGSGQVCQFNDVAVKDGIKLALFEIGNIFRYTWTGRLRCNAARLFYKASADLGDTKAMQELAWCYQTGFGTERSSITAAHILRIAEKERGLREIGNSWVWKPKYDLS